MWRQEPEPLPGQGLRRAAAGQCEVRYDAFQGGRACPGRDVHDRPETPTRPAPGACPRSMPALRLVSRHGGERVRSLLPVSRPGGQALVSAGVLPAEDGCTGLKVPRARWAVRDFGGPWLGPRRPERRRGPESADSCSIAGRDGAVGSVGGKGGQRTGWSRCEQQPFETAVWVVAHLREAAVLERHRAAERPPGTPVWGAEQGSSVTERRWVRPPSWA